MEDVRTPSTVSLFYPAFALGAIQTKHRHAYQLFLVASGQPSQFKCDVPDDQEDSLHDGLPLHTLKWCTYNRRLYVHTYV